MPSDYARDEYKTARTIIFLFLNSSMMQDRPTSWPAPLYKRKIIGTGISEATYRGLMVSWSLSSPPSVLSALRLAMLMGVNSKSNLLIYAQTG